MSTPVLLPVQCVKCQSPLSAEPDQVAWVCSACGQANLLDEKQPSGLSALEIQYEASIQSEQQGRPFWVVQAGVSLSRQTYSGNNSRDAQQFWGTPRTFFVPAFTCTLDEMVNLGMQLLLKPPATAQGQPVPFQPVTLALEDVRPMVEFIIMGTEAARRDMLKSVEIQMKLGEPTLWILP